MTAPNSGAGAEPQKYVVVDGQMFCSVEGVLCGAFIGEEPPEKFYEDAAEIENCEGFTRVQIAAVCEQVGAKFPTHCDGSFDDDARPDAPRAA